MADPTKTTTCPGCGRRTQGSHCQYPSNPLVNAQHPVKRDPLHAGGIPQARRGRAGVIKARNAANTFGGGSSGGWWEGNARLVKVGDTFAMMSQRYGTKQG